MNYELRIVYAVHSRTDTECHFFVIPAKAGIQTNGQFVG